jgi:hypothetical protein
MVSNVKRKPNFIFKVYLLIYQLYFFITFTTFRNVVTIPDPFLRPKLTKEYLENFFNTPKAFSYEILLISITSAIEKLSFVIFCVWLVIHITKWSKMDRITRVIYAIGITIVILVCSSIVIYIRTSSQPYYLFKSLLIGEVLSVTCFLLLVIQRKRQPTNGNSR